MKEIDQADDMADDTTIETPNRSIDPAEGQMMPFVDLWNFVREELRFVTGVHEAL